VIVKLPNDFSPMQHNAGFVCHYQSAHWGSILAALRSNAVG
jgi:hypothetical protein